MPMKPEQEVARQKRAQERAFKIRRALDQVLLALEPLDWAAAKATIQAAAAARQCGVDFLWKDGSAHSAAVERDES